MELEDAEKYFQSEKFQAGYHAYVMESKQQTDRIEHERRERERKRAEYEASPEFAIKQELEKARKVQVDMQNAVKVNVMQVLHDALVQAGAKCKCNCGDSDSYDYNDCECC